MIGCSFQQFHFLTNEISLSRGTGAGEGLGEEVLTPFEVHKRPPLVDKGLGGTMTHDQRLSRMKGRLGAGAGGVDACLSEASTVSMAPCRSPFFQLLTFYNFWA